MKAHCHLRYYGVHRLLNPYWWQLCMQSQWSLAACMPDINSSHLTNYLFKWLLVCLTSTAHTSQTISSNGCLYAWHQQLTPHKLSLQMAPCMPDINSSHLTNYLFKWLLVCLTSTAHTSQTISSNGCLYAWHQQLTPHKLSLQMAPCMPDINSSHLTNYLFKWLLVCLTSTAHTSQTNNLLKLKLQQTSGMCKSPVLWFKWHIPYDSIPVWSSVFHS